MKIGQDFRVLGNIFTIAIYQVYSKKMESLDRDARHRKTWAWKLQGLSPAVASFLMFESDYFLKRLLMRVPAKPTIPDPKSNIVVGSGIGAETSPSRTARALIRPSSW